MDITTLQAGRELDVLIAERVFGYSVRSNYSNPLIDLGRGDIRPLPEYSTDIAAAWLIIDYSLDPKNRLDWGFHSLIEGWTAYFWASGQSSLTGGGAHTPALAICRGALLAA